MEKGKRKRLTEVGNPNF